MIRPSLRWLLSALALSPFGALAYEPTSVTLSSGVSGDLTIFGAATNLINLGLGTIVVFCSAIFLYGAFTLATGISEDRAKKGKDIMKYSLFGLATVIGCGAIVATVLSLIYG